MAKKALSREDAFNLMSEAIISDDLELKREYRARNSEFDEQKVAFSDAEELVARGWEEVKRLRKKVLLKRKKRHGKQLEDDIWCLFKRAGYGEMNRVTLKVPFERDDGSIERKQVDVFAKDDETVLVIECKSKESRGRKSLQKDLAETRSFKAEMSSAIRTYYGEGFKPKIVWIYATRNIIWSADDLERAEAMHVKIITENEYAYYDSFIQHMGPAGRFQLLAEFLEGQKIAELEDVKVPAIKGKLGGCTYYAFVTTPKHLLKVSFVNHLALNHPDGRPAYQRMINSGRLKKIGQYISAGGFFPTNLLVNFSDKCRFDQISNKENAEETTKFGWLTLPSRYKSAWIIDGQHRLYGYSFLDQAYWNMNLFVLAFEQLDNRKEAELFITINHEQKSVPKAILVSLQADLKWDSADAKDQMAALTSGLVKSLAADATGPLGQRFVIEGVAAADTQSLTIPEVAKGVERSRLVGRYVNGVVAPGPLTSRTNDDTLKRAKKVLNGYFEIVRRADPARWEAGRTAFIATNPGIRAHLQLLGEILRDLDARRSFNAEAAPEAAIIEGVRPYLDTVVAFIRDGSDEQIGERFSRHFGEGGVRDYFFELCDLVASNQKFADFGPPEFKEYRKNKNDSRYGAAHADVTKLAKDISDYVYDKLKATYGTERVEGGDEAYWEKGVESVKAKTDAYNRRVSDPEDKRTHLFAYLDTLPLRDIVRQKNNWPHFQDVFNIPRPGEKGKTYYLDWMDTFNELRRIPAHPSKHRVYREEDYQFLEWIKEEFYSRLKKARASL